MILDWLVIYIGVLVIGAEGTYSARKPVVRDARKACREKELVNGAWQRKVSTIFSRNMNHC